MNATPYNARNGGNNGSGKDAGDVVAMRQQPGRGRDGGEGNGKGGTIDVPTLSSADRTDEQLLGDYRHGDKNAFSLLVSRYQRELYHFLVRFLGNRAAAEDVFQETF